MDTNKNASKEFGATMVEYALLVALIALSAIVAVRVLGTRISAQFSDVTEPLN